MALSPGQSGLPDAGLDLSFRNTQVISAAVKKKAPPTQWSLGGYLFDAWLRLHHNNSLTITQHPVQAGADISDHAFVNPKRFSFDICITDTVTSAQFTANPTRSINAYNVIQQMQASREPLTLVSKYGVYENILIESFEASDDFTTNTTLKATVNLVEIIIADVQVHKVSANPHMTDSTNRGQVAAQPEYGSLESIKLKLRSLFPMFNI